MGRAGDTRGVRAVLQASLAPGVCWTWVSGAFLIPPLGFDLETGPDFKTKRK